MGVDRRKRQGQFASIPYNLLESPAWISLPHSSHTLLLFIWRRYNGSNNGNLAAPFTEAKECGLFKSKATFYKAMDALWERGLIAMTRPGNWGSERTCHLWTITLRPVNQNLNLGITKSDRTDDWKRWSPDNPSPNFKKWFPLIQKQRSYLSTKAHQRHQGNKNSCVEKFDVTRPKNGRMRVV